MKNKIVDEDAEELATLGKDILQTVEDGDSETVTELTVDLDDLLFYAQESATIQRCAAANYKARFSLLCLSGTPKAVETISAMQSRLVTGLSSMTAACSS